jgi:hypothetical protein
MNVDRQPMTCCSEKGLSYPTLPSRWKFSVISIVSSSATRLARLSHLRRRDDRSVERVTRASRFYVGKGICLPVTESHRRVARVVQSKQRSAVAEQGTYYDRHEY